MGLSVFGSSSGLLCFSTGFDPGGFTCGAGTGCTLEGAGIGEASGVVGAGVGVVIGAGEGTGSGAGAGSGCGFDRVMFMSVCGSD